jgi:hypothetical protein
MDETYEIKKVRGDKIALLGLFALSLLTAYLITVLKSALVLSEPIELSHTGLTLSVPSGNGWLSEKQWKYHENAFTLSSVFAPEPVRPDAIVRCQYLFTADRTSPQMRFEQKASGVDGTIVKTGRTQKGVLTIDWAQIKTPQTLLNLFFGTVDLPGNRRLNIEVHQVRGNANIAEKTFKRITESLNFNDNRLLEDGSGVVAEIRSRGVTSFLDNQSQQVFFLIKTVRMNAEQTIGFTMDVLVGTGQSVEPVIQAASLLYTRAPYSQEQVTSFQGDNSFNRFVWKGETYSAAGRSGTEIIADKNDVITVRKFDVQPEEKSYQLSPAAIPNIFLQQVLSQMLDSGKKETVVDIIRPDGTIAPTFIRQTQGGLISRIESDPRRLASQNEAAGAVDEGAGYILEVGFLCEGGFSEQVYLDGKKQISKKVFPPFLLSQESRGASVLERVAQEDIIREFPERADFILQKSNPLKPDSSQ